MTQLKNSFPVTFSALRINLQKIIIFPLRVLTTFTRAILQLWLSLYMKLKCCLASKSFLLAATLNRSQSELHITGLWLPVPRKKYDFKTLKTFRGWVPMNCHGTKKMFSTGLEILGLVGYSTLTCWLTCNQKEVCNLHLNSEPLV